MTHWFVAKQMATLPKPLDAHIICYCTYRTCCFLLWPCENSVTLYKALQSKFACSSLTLFKYSFVCILHIYRLQSICNPPDIYIVCVILIFWNVSPPQRGTSKEHFHVQICILEQNFAAQKLFKTEIDSENPVLWIIFLPLRERNVGFCSAQLQFFVLFVISGPWFESQHRKNGNIPENQLIVVLGF